MFFVWGRSKGAVSRQGSRTDTRVGSFLYYLPLLFYDELATELDALLDDVAITARATKEELLIGNLKLPLCEY